jgi:hypothetical protein
MDLPLFCDGLIQNLCLELFFDVYLLKPGVFGFQYFHADHHRGNYAAVFSALFIKGGSTDTQCAENINYSKASIDPF